jgi:hypothetical protein
MMRVLSRRSFLKIAGVAAGATAIGVAPATAETSPELVDEPTALEDEPLVAIVRDSRKGEVTLLSGKAETTYRDPALVKRLLKAAPRRANSGRDAVA